MTRYFFFFCLGWFVFIALIGLAQNASEETNVASFPVQGFSFSTGEIATPSADLEHQTIPPSELERFQIMLKTPTAGLSLEVK